MQLLILQETLSRLSCANYDEKVQKRKSFNNVYDYKIHQAQLLLKEAKANLAEAKKRAKKK